MNVTKKRLTQIIKEELEEAYVASLAAKPSGEAKMAKSQLLRTAEYSTKLINMLEDDSDLEPWVQSKITLASDYLSKVYHHLHGEEVLDQE
jgi:transcriptional/translational regulatory protein YebC/TACO1